MSSIGVLPVRGRIESVDHGSKLEKPLHWKSRRICYVDCGAVRSDHPCWKMEGRSISIANYEVSRSRKLLLADSYKRLTKKWMEPVGDRHLERQTPGIMSPPRTKVACAPHTYTPWSNRLGSTESIRKPILPTSSIAWPRAGRARVWRSCCPGTGLRPRISRPLLLAHPRLDRLEPPASNAVMRPAELALSALLSCS